MATINVAYCPACGRIIKINDACFYGKHRNRRRRRCANSRTLAKVQDIRPRL